MAEYCCRIPPLQPEAFSETQKAVVGEWGVLNFSRVLAHHPELYRVFVPLVEKVIRFTALPPVHREILVLRTLALCNEEYEAAHHDDIAEKAGMSPDMVNAVRLGGECLPEFERYLVRAADELVSDQRISDEAWEVLAQQYSTIEMMEVVGLVGCYVSMAMITKSFGIPLESEGDAASQLSSLREYT